MNILVDLKTNIPDNGYKVIRREGLYQTLDNKLTDWSSLLLVSAPAGYGKTTLVSEWLKGKECHKAWLSLSEEDSDTHSFFHGLIAALQKVDSKLCRGTENILQMPTTPELEEIISSFVQELKMVKGQLVLVIDDYHYIENDYIHQFVDNLIKYIPENILLIMITREEPPLTLNRYRINGKLEEINEKDLSFDYSEMVELYNDIISLQIDESDIRELYDWTEGWISGIKLAGLRLMNKEKEEVHQFVKDFSGSHYYIIDYLVEEVLAQLDDDLKDFIYKTSIVDRFNSELCGHLTDRRDSSQILKRLDQMNIFLISLDSSRSWFRYHHLFRDSVISDLSPVLKKELHIKAAKWFGQNGYYQDAINQGIKAKNYQLAVEYIDASIPEYLDRGDIKGISRLLDTVPDEYISDRGLLLIMKAWSLFVTGKTPDAIYYLDLIKKRPELMEEKNRGWLLTLRSLTTLTVGVDEDADAAELAKEALTLLGEKDYLCKLYTLMSLGQSYAYKGDLEESAHHFQQAYYLAREVGQFFLEITALINYAFILEQLGNLQEGLTLCNHNLERFKYESGEVGRLAQLIYTPLGVFHYQMGEFGQAREFLVKVVEICEHLKLVYVYWMAMTYYARTCFELGETDLAFEIIDDTLNFTKENNFEVEYQKTRNIKREFNLRLGKLDLTPEKTEGYKEVINEKFSPDIGESIFTYCRILLQDGNTNDVGSCLERFVQPNDHRYVDNITAHLLLARAYFRSNDNKKAKSNLLTAIQMAKKEGYSTVFIQEGGAILPLLNQYRDLAPTFLDKIIDNIQRFIDKTADKIDKSLKIDKKRVLVEPLTDREMEILTLVAEGLSNKDIADKLFITQGTTKWHLTNVYGKLGVDNRTQAVAKAIDLKIVNI